MKKHINILLIVSSILLVLLLTGFSCVGSSSDLRGQIEEQNIPKAKEWFKENMSDCEIDEISIVSGPYLCSSDLVEGTYKKGENTYNFFLNVDTSDCITNENTKYYEDKLNEGFAKELDLSPQNVRVSADGQSISGHTASDESFNKKTDDVEYSKYSVPTNGYLQYNITKEDIDSLVNDTVSDDSANINISITLDTDKDVVDKFYDLEYIENHPLYNVEIKVKDTNSDTTSYLLYEDQDNNEYTLIRYYKVDGNVEHEIINSKKTFIGHKGPFF